MARVGTVGQHLIIYDEYYSTYTRATLDAFEALQSKINYEPVTTGKPFLEKLPKQKAQWKQEVHTWKGKRR